MTYSLKEVLGLIRKHCQLCDNGVAGVDEIPRYAFDDNGEYIYIGCDHEPIECQYCGELIQVIENVESKETP